MTASEESIKYENFIKGYRNTNTHFEKVISTTTTFWFKKTVMIEHIINEIVGSDVRYSKLRNNT